MSDKKTVSKQDFELSTVARKKKVPVFVVMAAKYYTGSTKREVIEKWIDENEIFISERMKEDKE